MLNFSELILDELELREMSLGQLALKADVTKGSLYCWLHGSSPKVSSLEKVLNSLGYELAIVEKD